MPAAMPEGLLRWRGLAGVRCERPSHRSGAHSHLGRVTLRRTLSLALTSGGASVHESKGQPHVTNCNSGHHRNGVGLGDDDGLWGDPGPASSDRWRHRCWAAPQSERPPGARQAARWSADLVAQRSEPRRRHVERVPTNLTLGVEETEAGVGPPPPPSPTLASL